MYLFLSFIVAIMSLYFLCQMATSPYYYNQDATTAVILLIYSVVTIIKELHKEDDYLPYDNSYHTNTRSYSTSSKYFDNYFAESPYDYGWHDNKPVKQEKIEVFAPDKKEVKEKDERPEVWHYPSKKEAREKIAEMEKNPFWVIKRNFCSVIGVDITEKYYQPHYVKSDVVVKKVNREDHSRFMPNGNFVSNYESETYNNIAKTLGRSCDIAFDGDNFVEEITIKNEKESESCSASVNGV